ncbi:MAG: peptidyl-prolyl cis-trans isomerase [Candidatus Tectomicrobia bacterium]|uniref:peptidylprolyl isomerase n=1 Tax=Tectimicrobiota bacterium TaxID=2528274 RepID=A0A932I2Z8_UNCTE|nr:peptidyl-prolyl cis-trans isomerase [Candidatus Tectomicrobia bacterium]
MSRPLAAGLLAALLSFGPAGCGEDSSPGAALFGELLAEVNGEPITVGDLRAALMADGKHMLSSAQRRGEALRSLLEQMVERRLMLQRFRESGEHVDEGQVRAYVEAVARQYGPEGFDAVLREDKIDREKWVQTVRETLEIEQLLGREIYSKLSASEEEVRAYYARNRERFRVGRRWRVRQIVAGTEEAAEKLRARLLQGASFEQVARSESQGPERARGGDLGFFESGELPESIEAVIKYLDEGEVSRVVGSPSGYHLFQVTERRSAGIRPLESVREEIMGELLSQKGREQIERWLASLKEKASIRYHWRNLDHVPLG